MSSEASISSGLSIPSMQSSTQSLGHISGTRTQNCCLETERKTNSYSFSPKATTNRKNVKKFIDLYISHAGKNVLAWVSGTFFHWLAKKNLTFRKFNCIDKEKGRQNLKCKLPILAEKYITFKKFYSGKSTCK